MARAKITTRRSTRNTAASKTPKWIDRAKTVPYPAQLWGDPLYDRAIEHARATIGIRWNRFVEFLLTADRAEVAEWIIFAVAEQETLVDLMAATVDDPLFASHVIRASA